MRWSGEGGRFVLVTVEPGRRWVLGRLSGRRGDPVERDGDGRHLGRRRFNQRAAREKKGAEAARNRGAHHSKPLPLRSRFGK